MQLRKIFTSMVLLSVVMFTTVISEANQSRVEVLSNAQAKSLLGVNPAKGANGYVLVTFEGDFSNKDKIYNTLRTCSVICNWSAMWGIVFINDNKAIWYGPILAVDAGKVFSYDLVKYSYGQLSPTSYGMIPGSLEVIIEGPSFRVNRNGRGIEVL